MLTQAATHFNFLVACPKDPNLEFGTWESQA